MSIESLNEAGGCRIRIDDELTLYTASLFARTLNEALVANRSVAIDLTGVTEIDCAGLQILLMARKEALLRNRVVRFIGQNPVVLECLHLMNLSNFFKFETTRPLAA